MTRWGVPAVPDREAFDMLMIPGVGGAWLAFCDAVCLDNSIPPDSPEGVSVPDAPFCRTCWCCELTIPGTRCPCQFHGLSCTAESWLLTQEAPVCVQVIATALGPVPVTEAMWREWLSLTEVFHSGWTVAEVWLQQRLGHDTDLG